MEKYTLYTFYQKQHQLDLFIFEQRQLAHPHLPDRVRALRCELAELQNEWKGFKFWKQDQTINRERLLDEYADVFHFALSLGVWNSRIDLMTEYTAKVMPTIGETFDQLFISSVTILNPDSHKIFIELFIGLGKQLGISLADWKESYESKYQENIDRQNRGY